MINVVVYSIREWISYTCIVKYSVNIIQQSVNIIRILLQLPTRVFQLQNYITK